MTLFTKSKTLRQFGSVASGNTATLALPLGVTYTEIFIKYEGMTLDDIGEVRLMINGDVVDRYLSGAQLVVMNEYRGLETTAGILHYPLIRPCLRGRAQRQLSAIGVGVGQLDANGKPKPESVVQINTLALEIDIKDTATAPHLTATALSEPPRVGQVLRKTRHWTHDVPQSGEYEISNYPRGEVIERMYFSAKNTNGNVIKIRSAEIMTNSSIVYQRTKEINEHIITNGFVRNVNGDMFVIDFTEQGFGSDGLQTRGLQELRIKLDVAAACVVASSIEYFGRLERK